jgi:hypothetical protein
VSRAESRAATRRVPQRSCVACRRTAAKRDLVRLVRTAEGAVRVDERGRSPGRGAYLCRARDCWERALGGDSLARALRMKLSAEDRAALDQYARGLELPARQAPATLAGAGGGERR